MPFNIYPINIVLVVLVLIPNLLFIIFPPVNMPVEREKPLWWNVIIILEQISRVAVFALPLFWNMKISGRGKVIILSLMIVCILVYYSGWLRYIIGGRQYSLLFSPLFLIPVPMAVFPALYLILCGVLLESWQITLAAVIFTAAHIAESLRNYYQL